MKIKTGVFLLLFLVSNLITAQQTDSVATASVEEDEGFYLFQNGFPAFFEKDTTKHPFVFSPSISVGTGLLSFFGDLTTKDQQPFSNSKLGLSLDLSNPLTRYYQLNINFLYGNLVANENVKHNDRELINFESKIISGGASIQYNFGHFIPSYNNALPYLTVGVEVFSFKSKMDALDKNGNQYYYWTDGSIRDIDENDVNAVNATEINRDYNFESDIKAMDLERDDYNEVAFAVPIGLGVMFKLNEYIDIKLGTTIHFTFTDYIDGVTFTSKNDRQGNNKYDHFLMSAFAIQYNFSSYKKDNNISSYKDVDFVSLDTLDFDEDGVVDHLDSCQGTPKGAIVDSKGCPLDDDKDNYPNYKDKEPTTPANAIVDENGVTLSEEQIEKRYNNYINSVMEGEIIKTSTANPNQIIARPFSANRTASKEKTEKKKPTTTTTTTTIDSSSVASTGKKPSTNTITKNAIKQKIKTGTASKAETEEQKPYHTATTTVDSSSVALIGKKPSTSTITKNAIKQKTKTGTASKQKNSTPFNETIYLIERGDNLTTIAKNNGCSISELMKWNNLTSSAIQAGQTLNIRKKENSKQAKTYLVKKGDSLSSIAKQYRITISDLLNWNGAAATSIAPGSVLNIATP